MRNLKKILGLAAICVTAAAMAVGFTACGGGDDVDPTPSPDDPTTDGITITYQFVGTYDETASYGFAYTYMLNLYSDGTAAGCGYNYLSMDSASYADNTGFYESWWSGSWKDDTNDEGVSYVSLTVMYGTDATNFMTGSALTGRFTYELYPNSNGQITFTLDLPIFSGRTGSVTSSATVQYSDYDSFIQGSLYTWTEPAGYAAVFDSTSDSSGTARVYCFSDGTASFYTGSQDPATGTYKYILSSDAWTWSYDDETLTIYAGDTDGIEVTVEGTSGTFTYSQTLMGYTTSYTFQSSDVSSLNTSNNAGGDDTAAVEELLVLTDSTSGATLTFYSDNTAEISAYYGYLTLDFTWTYADGVPTLTKADDSATSVTATEADGTYTISYSESWFSTYGISSLTFTTNDFSALG